MYLLKRKTQSAGQRQQLAPDLQVQRSFVQKRRVSRCTYICLPISDTQRAQKIVSNDETLKIREDAIGTN
jgi:hypothetical protein